MDDATNKKRKVFVSTILTFWNTDRRDFPWRHTRDPYVILITEILLRRTTAGHVKKIYDKFFVKYKCFEDILKTPKSEIAKDIKEIGLSNQRAEQLKELARVVINDYGGRVPRNRKAILDLPGVGKYTCAAVMCLAFGKKAAMVDANFVRVINRYFGGSYENLNYNHKALWELAETLVPGGKCRDFNLGLMDFSAIICAPRKPKCEKCGTSKLCSYYEKCST